MPARKYLRLFLALLGLLVAQPSFAQQRVLPRNVPSDVSLPVRSAADVGPEPRAVLYVMRQRKDVFPLNSENNLVTVQGMAEMWPFTPVHEPGTRQSVQFGGWINDTGPRFCFGYKGLGHGLRMETPTYTSFSQIVAAVQSLGPDDKLMMRVTTGEGARYVRAPSNHPYNNTYDRQYVLFEHGAISGKGVISGKMPVLGGEDLTAVRPFSYKLEDFRDSYVDRTTEYVKNYGNSHEYHVLILRLPPKKEAKAAPAPAEPGA